MTEFLNNIWMAVSTPNEGLLSILSIPMVFIEVSISLYFITAILNMSISQKQKYSYITATSIVSLIAGFILKNPINVIFNFICLFFIVHITLKTNILKTTIASVLPSFIFSIIQSLLFKPYITLLNITFEEAISIVIYKLPFTLFMYILIFLIAFIIKHKKLTINIIDELDKKSIKFVITYLIIGFIYLLVEVFMTAKYLNILPLSYTFANFIILLVYFCISLYCISKIINLTNTTQKLESAKEYNKTLHILHDNVRGFKHDFDNMVTTIGGYIATDDMEGLKKYYLELEKDCEKVNNLYILNPDSINNPGIYNLLTAKYYEATEKDIDIDIYYLLDLNELNMKIYEFARILGILLDNAIEAAEQSNEKIIHISFRKDHSYNKNIITIENSYSNKEVDTETIFNKGFSEKENHTGLGLWEVNKLISKNNNVELKTTKTNELFKQQLEINCK